MKIVFFKNLTDAQKNKIEKFGIWAFFISSAVSTFIFLVLSIPAFLSSSQGAVFYLGFIFIPTSAFCLLLGVVGMISFALTMRKKLIIVVIPFVLILFFLLNLYQVNFWPFTQTSEYLFYVIPTQTLSISFAVLWVIYTTFSIYLFIHDILKDTRDLTKKGSSLKSIAHKIVLMIHYTLISLLFSVFIFILVLLLLVAFGFFR